MKSLFLTGVVIILLAYSCITGSNESNSKDSNNARIQDTLSPQSVIDTAQIEGRWNLIPAMTSDTANRKVALPCF